MPVLIAFSGKADSRALGMGLEKLPADNLGGPTLGTPFWITSASRDAVAKSLGPAMNKGTIMLLVTVASRDDVQLLYPPPGAK